MRRLNCSLAQLHQLVAQLGRRLLLEFLGVHVPYLCSGQFVPRARSADLRLTNIVGTESFDAARRNASRAVSS
jgi:hypothetical protein